MGFLCVKPNFDTKRRADALPDVQTGEAKERKKRHDEFTIQSSRKDSPESEPRQRCSSPIGSIDGHPLLGAILSITNLDQTVIRYTDNLQLWAIQLLLWYWFYYGWRRPSNNLLIYRKSSAYFNLVAMKTSAAWCRIKQHASGWIFD